MRRVQRYQSPFESDESSNGFDSDSSQSSLQSRIDIFEDIVRQSRDLAMRKERILYKSRRPSERIVNKKNGSRSSFKNSTKLNSDNSQSSLDQLRVNSKSKSRRNSIRLQNRKSIKNKPKSSSESILSPRKKKSCRHNSNIPKAEDKRKKYIHALNIPISDNIIKKNQRISNVSLAKIKEQNKTREQNKSILNLPISDNSMKKYRTTSNIHVSDNIPTLSSPISETKIRKHRRISNIHLPRKITKESNLKPSRKNSISINGICYSTLPSDDLNRSFDHPNDVDPIVNNTSIQPRSYLRQLPETNLPVESRTLNNRGRSSMCVTNTVPDISESNEQLIRNITNKLFTGKTKHTQLFNNEAEDIKLLDCSYVDTDTTFQPYNSGISRYGLKTLKSESDKRKISTSKSQSPHRVNRLQYLTGDPTNVKHRKQFKTQKPISLDKEITIPNTSNNSLSSDSCRNCMKHRISANNLTFTPISIFSHNPLMDNVPEVTSKNKKENTKRKCRRKSKQSLMNSIKSNTTLSKPKSQLIFEQCQEIVSNKNKVEKLELKVDNLPINEYSNGKKETPSNNNIVRSKSIKSILSESVDNIISSYKDENICTNSVSHSSNFDDFLEYCSTGGKNAKKDELNCLSESGKLLNEAISPGEELTWDVESSASQIHILDEYEGSKSPLRSLDNIISLKKSDIEDLELRSNQSLPVSELISERGSGCKSIFADAEAFTALAIDERKDLNFDTDERKSAISDKRNLCQPECSTLQLDHDYNVKSDIGNVHRLINDSLVESSYEDKLCFAVHEQTLLCDARNPKISESQIRDLQTQPNVFNARISRKLNTGTHYLQDGRIESTPFDNHDTSAIPDAEYTNEIYERWSNMDKDDIQGYMERAKLDLKRRNGEMDNSYILALRESNKERPQNKGIYDK